MAKALRYRLFGMGKMPPELKAAGNVEGLLFTAEGVSVRQTVDALKIPRANVRHGVKLLIGAVVVLPDRLLLSSGKSVIVDTGLEPQPEAPAAVRFDHDGIRVTFDVAGVVDDGSGTMELHYRLPLEESLLADLPATPVHAPIADPWKGLLNGWKGTWSR